MVVQLARDLSFTVPFLRSLKPDAKRVCHYEKDRRYQGFLVEVLPSGRISYRYRYTLKGKRDKVTLGWFPNMTLAQARERYRECLELVHRGISPARQKKLADTGQLAERTFGDLASDWMTNVHRKATKQPRQAQVYLDRDILPLIGQKPLTSLSVGDLWMAIQRVVDRGHLQAAVRVRGVLKQILSYGVSRGDLVVNLATSIDPSHIARPKSRDRVLSKEEIPVWIHAIETSSMARPMKLALRLLLLIPVRKGELFNAKWSDIDFDGRTWDIPKENSKNGTPLRHRLTDQVLAIFHELKQYALDSQWVLPSSRGNGRRPVSKTTINRCLGAVRGVPEGMVIHDLRRTVRTHMSELGVAQHIAELCLNHRPTGIKKVYDRSELIDQRFEALKLWDNYLRDLLSMDASSDAIIHDAEVESIITKLEKSHSVRAYVLKRLMA